MIVPARSLPHQLPAPTPAELFSEASHVASGPQRACSAVIHLPPVGLLPPPPPMTSSDVGNLRAVTCGARASWTRPQRVVFRSIGSAFLVHSVHDLAVRVGGGGGGASSATPSEGAWASGRFRRRRGGRRGRRGDKARLCRRVVAAGAAVSRAAGGGHGRHAGSGLIARTQEGYQDNNRTAAVGTLGATRQTQF